MTAAQEGHSTEQSVDQPDPRLIATLTGRCLHLQLNNTATLNAFDESLSRAMRYHLRLAATDETVDYVLVTSLSEKSFCSGGNVRQMAQFYADGETARAEEFFAVEYDLCALISEFPKPYITLVNGYCIGGGLGISANGSYMVVSEKALMSMPEAGLGFCTDAGMSWVLPHLWGDGGQADKALGMYLALTGRWLSAADALWCGLAGYYLPSSEFPALAEGLLTLSYEPGCARTAITTYLSEHTQLPAEESSLAEIILQVDEVFSAPSVSEMMTRLQLGLDTRRYGMWAREALSALRACSPTALQGTFLAIEWGNNCPDVRTAVQHEHRLGAQYLCHRPDFQNGVRAKLIDKKPYKNWDPPTLDEVDMGTLRTR